MQYNSSTQDINSSTKKTPPVFKYLSLVFGGLRGCLDLPEAELWTLVFTISAQCLPGSRQGRRGDDTCALEHVCWRTPGPPQSLTTGNTTCAIHISG